jgi:type VI secretion system protein ImpB
MSVSLFPKGLVSRKALAKKGTLIMAKESLQKKVGRVRPPRVHITYDVQVGDAIEKRDLPFVVGVLADLSGMPDKPLPPIAKRKFVSIDRDNVNDVMKKIEPRLAFKVPNRLSEDDTKLNVELRFDSMEDFQPAKVAQQITPLRKLLELRNSLANLRSSLIGNEKLESLLQEMIQNQEMLRQAGSEAGIKADEKKES